MQIVIITMLVVVGSRSFLSAPRAQATTDIGYRDFSFGTVGAPTAEKPQNKLWFNDGIWWGSLYSRGSGKYQIHRLDWASQTWSDTGVVIDERRTARMDALWNGTFLYIATAVRPSTNNTDTTARVLRYSYDATSKTYTLDSGFPVIVAPTVANHVTAAIVLDRDSAGKLWVTYTLDGKVYVAHSTGDDRTWTTPFVIPVTGATNLLSEDMSSVVAFNGQIGVMWSNQNDNAMYFAVHKDGDSDNTWQLNPAIQGPKYADNHLNLASLEADASGQVFAATKTSLNDGTSVNPDDPLVLLLTLGHDGAWSRRTVWRVADDVTRAIVLIDNQNRQIYVFGAAPCCSGGTIYYKQASLDNASLQFPQGLGNPFIQLSTDPKINNVTSTKQALNSSTGLVVLAGDDSTGYYVHNAISLGTSNATPTATATATVEPTPTDTATATATATVEPTPTDTATATATVEPTPTDTVTATATPVAAEELMFSDGFETGDASQWTTVNGLVVQQQELFAGSYAARGTSNGTVTYARKQLSASQSELYYRVRFKILSQGANEVHLLQFRTADDLPILGLIVDSSGQLGYLNGSTGLTTRSSTGVSQGSWHEVQVRALVLGADSQTEVWLDGVRVDALGKTEPLGSAAIGRIQLGENWTGRTYDIAFDDIGVDTRLIDATDTEPPTAPSNLSIVATSPIRADLTWTAASDNVGVTRYDIYRNGVLLSITDGITSYTDTTVAPSTTYQYHVRARDAAGNTSDSSNLATVTTPADTMAPSVVLAEPADMALVTGPVTLAADATDDVAVDRVVFFVNGKDVGTDSSAPYSISWDSTGIADGAATIAARAIDTSSNATTSATRSVTVENTAPETTIESGPSDEVNSSSASFSFSATEENATFECSLDSGTFSICTSPKNYSSLVDGPHTFQVRGTDLAGNTDASPAVRSWAIQEPPTVTLTQPANGATVNGMVKIAASAGDNTKVKAVHFYLDNVLLSTDSAAPFEYSWNTRKSTTGSHKLHAIAEDTAGNTASSTSITVTVSR